MNQTAKDISRMLSDRVDSVVKHLLPNGKRNGAEWECGSTAGEAGASLKVRLNGTNAGIWADFAGNEKGDLLDLWAACRQKTLGEAIKEAKEFLGVRSPYISDIKPKAYSKPKKPAGVSSLKPADPVREYLENERKLAPASLEAYKVASQGSKIVFPYIGADGQLANIKYLDTKRDENGKKIISTEKGCAPALFGWQALSSGSRVVAITEGELDAITLYQYGIEALSVPFGAGTGNKLDWIDYEWDNLERFDTIYLCYDNDDAGQASIKEVAQRLGIHRCRIVTFPKKDANECLQAGIDEGLIARALKDAKSIVPPEICSPNQFAPATVEYFYPPEGKPQGFNPELFSRKVTFGIGEVTVWTGYSAHGKSALLGEMMLFTMLEGQKVAIASMEMKPQQTLGRMLKQFWAKSLPSVYEINNALEWMGGRLWIYDILGNVAPKKLLELMNYSSQRHGVHHFVIDSLMKCSVGSEDYDAQRVFLNDLSTFAKQTGCHIHLVAHLRKGPEEEIVGKEGIKGSNDIGNQVDNSLTVWRNKKKENGCRNGNAYSFIDPDVIVYCDKQRESGWEGNIPLFFLQDCLQFVDKEALDPKKQDFRRFRMWRYAGVLSNKELENPL
jgi:twinkle protein